MMMMIGTIPRDLLCDYHKLITKGDLTNTHLILKFVLRRIVSHYHICFFVIRPQVIYSQYTIVVPHVHCKNKLR